MFSPGNFVESFKKELELHLDEDYVSAEGDLTNGKHLRYANLLDVYFRLF